MPLRHQTCSHLELPAIDKAHAASNARQGQAVLSTSKLQKVSPAHLGSIDSGYGTVDRSPHCNLNPAHSRPPRIRRLILHEPDGAITRANSEAQAGSLSPLKLME
jgi:hypothetical protein